MTRSLVVLMNGVRAGEVIGRRAGRLTFAYDDAYRRRPGATPLSFAMPLEDREFTNSVIAPWLAGLLPDNRDVLARWARQFEIGSTEPFALLGTPVGEDCAGAVQFVREPRLEALLADSGSVEWLSDVDVEERLRALREDETAWLGGQSAERPEHLTGQFSLAGRQRKTALLRQDGRWGVPSGRIPTTHILKPPITRVDDVSLYEQEVNEHLCLDAARRVGIAAAQTTVQAFGKERVIVVTRYDRQRQDGTWLRVHQEDLCQALGVYPDHKYEWENGPNITDIAAVLRRSSSPALAEKNVARFADGLIWNWIVAGSDAHAKNYSLLLAGREVRLAPLYDITSGLPYWRDRKLGMAMKLDDGYAMFACRDPWLAAAGRLGMDPDELHERVLDLCDRAPQAFSEASADPTLVALGGLLPARLTRDVANRAKWARKLLGARRL